MNRRSFFRSLAVATALAIVPAFVHRDVTPAHRRTRVLLLGKQSLEMVEVEGTGKWGEFEAFAVDRAS